MSRADPVHIIARSSIFNVRQIAVNLLGSNHKEEVTIMQKQVSRMLLAIICCLFLMISCGGGGGGGETEVVKVLPTPRISVSGTTNDLIEFGNVVWGNVSEQTISIQNTGDASSSLSIGQIAGANGLAAPFSILNDNCSAKSLAVSQTCTFQVRFAPSNQLIPSIDSFDIPSNDPSKLSQLVNVTGNGRGLRVFINDIICNRPNIDLLVTVTDKDGVQQPWLLGINFQVKENGNDVSSTVTMLPLIQKPLSVALALDYSNSMPSSSITLMETAAQQIVAMLDGVNDGAAIIKYAAAIEVTEPLTSDKNALVDAIDKQDYAGSRLQTHLYDAIWEAIEQTTALPANSRTVVVLTDGYDENCTSGTCLPGSVHTIAEVIAHANDNKVPIFTIGLYSLVLKTDVLSKLATETGGQYFYAQNDTQLAAIYGTISQILSGKYFFTYKTLSNPGSPITLDVVVTNNSGKQGEVIRQFTGCP
jgi:hypothetical protein